MTRASLTALALLVLAMSTAGQSPAPQPRESFHLFLLAGQSNMAGRGKVEAQDTVPTPGVLMFDRARTWVPAIDPMHFDKPVAGVGLGRSFAARVLAATPGVTIGLVPTAVGGTRIDLWQPGAYDEETKTHPWDDAIARASVALRAGTLKAILWHQGESDARPDLAPGYEAKLHALIARFRDTLRAPDVPFIVGQLGQYPDVAWDEARRTVDAAHRALPGKVSRTAFVPSDGLVHDGDRIHFDRASLQEFGRRYAAAYATLMRH